MATITNEQANLQVLAGELEGDIFYDDTMRILYATDASAYRELPLAVAFPRSQNDLKKLYLQNRESWVNKLLFL